MFQRQKDVVREYNFCTIFYEQLGVFFYKNRKTSTYFDTKL